MSAPPVIDPRQLEADRDALRLIAERLDALEREWDDARPLIQARQRGYFTPEEDDRARLLLLAYRNYRLGLWEIISHYFGYDRIPDPAHRLRCFLVAFGAALTVYAKSLRLVHTYEHDPLVRQKLNEPEPKFDIEAGLFDEVLRRYSSFRNHWLLWQANRFWRRHRRLARSLRLQQDPEWRWLVGRVRRERRVVQTRLLGVFLRRLRYDWRMLWQTTLAPIREARYRAQSLVGGTFAGFRLSNDYRPGLTEDRLTELSGRLRPGDILLMRAEGKLTSALLPGFWAHAALYLGRREALAPLALEGHPQVRSHWGSLRTEDQGLGCVLEAISPRALVNAFQRSLQADHVVALRPRLGTAELGDALVEAFAHVGKPYDFEFDFNVTHRIVCTELIYRAYHGRGGIALPLVKRLGRYTLTGDDIVHAALDAATAAASPEAAPLRPVQLLLKSQDGPSTVLPEADLLPRLRALRTGWRPAGAG